MTLWEGIGLAFVGFLAGAINVIAGGGSLLTLPMLMLLGLPANAANATNRLAILAQSSVASARFYHKGVLEPSRGIQLAIPTVLGALLGAQLSVDIHEALFRQVIGVMMCLVLLSLFVNPKRWLASPSSTAPPARHPLIQWIVFFTIGVYAGFLQAGVGVFFLVGFVFIARVDLVRANALKVALVATLTVPALAVFLWHNLIDWHAGLVQAGGQVCGAWVGANLSIDWGPNFIRWVLLVVVSISSTKLLGLW